MIQHIRNLLGGAFICAVLPFATPLSVHAHEASHSEPLLRTNLLLDQNPRRGLVQIHSVSAWKHRRQQILQAMQEIMGPFPGKEKECSLDLQILSETNCGPYTLQSVTYAAEPGARTPAFLLIPRAALHPKHKLPAVLALHPTDLEAGNRVIVNPLRPHYPAYARDLAQRGYVILAPAYPMMGGYNPDLKSLGYSSGTMKAIWDNVRGLDLLESLSFVRKGKFGAIGHSLGGHNSIFTAAFDPRIQVVVSSCGFDSFQDYYRGDPTVWQPERGWCQERYMPRLANYRGRLGEIPFDFYELLGALAPQPVFVNAPLGDTNFNSQSVDRIISAASRVYELYGAHSELHVVHPNCSHEFPPEIRQAAYKFLDDHLR